MLLAQVASAGSLPGRTVLIFHLWFFCLRETPSARLGIDQSVHSVLLSFTLGKAVVQPCDVYHVWVWPSGLSTSQQTKEGSRLSTFFYLALVPLWPLCICKTDIYTLWSTHGGHHRTDTCNYWTWCPFVILPDCDACFSILCILLYASTVYLSIPDLYTSLDHFVPQKQVHTAIMCTNIYLRIILPNK